PQRGTPSGHVNVSAPLSVEYMTLLFSSRPSSFAWRILLLPRFLSATHGERQNRTKRALPLWQRQEAQAWLRRRRCDQRGARDKPRRRRPARPRVAREASSQRHRRRRPGHALRGAEREAANGARAPG